MNQRAVVAQGAIPADSEVDGLVDGALHAGAHGVTESAVMIRHTIPQEFRQALPRGCFLGRGQSQRVAHR